jgi:cytochrome P450
MDDEKDQMIPDHVVLNEATNVIVAGTDTTALTLTYLVYAVLKHDDVKNRLLEELQTCPPAPKWGDLEKLPYLHNVIYETFRLYPIIPGTLPRIVPVGGEKLGRYIIPAGTQVRQTRSFRGS